MSKLVYLAGSITGLDFKGCTDWRQYAIAELAQVGITGVSPMRCKEYLDGLGPLSGHGREYAKLGLMSGPKAILARDFFDCTRADVLLVNLLGAKQVSIGTMFELAWAFQKRTPVVLIMEEQGGLHDHMFPREAAGWIVQDLDVGIQIVKGILQ